MVSRIYYLSHRALPTTERWVEWTGDVDQPVSGEGAVALQTVASLADRYRWSWTYRTSAISCCSTRVCPACVTRA